MRSDESPGQQAPVDARRALRRRPLLALAAGWPVGASWAQPSGRPRRIAFLAAGSAPGAGRFDTFQTILQGLRAIGHASIEPRAWYGDGRAEALPALAQQLLAWHPELIITNLTPATLAASRATRTVPIVMAGSGDPVATGLVQSLARPGGNVTGVGALGPELAAKSVELLHELRPTLRRLGVLAHATDSFTPTMLDAVARAATARGLEPMVERVLEPGQYAAAFAGWQRARIDAVFVQPSLPGKLAIDLALQARLPTCSFVRGFVEQGGLIAYVNDLAEIARLVIDFADRILRGAAPAQLPVQQNTRFQLLINLRTARTLGMAIAADVRARADELIE